MKVKNPEQALLLVTGVIMLLGVSFIATISAPTSMDRFGTTNYYFIHQLIYGIGAGLVAGLAAYILPIKWIKKIAPFLLLLNLILVFAVIVSKLGANFWGASRWLNIGGVIFQPSEFLKITSILYLASWLKNRLNPDSHKAVVLRGKGPVFNAKMLLVPFGIFLSVIAVGLIFQRDMTTLGIIGITMLFMYFAAGTPKWHIPVLILGAVLLFAFMVLIEPYRMSRIMTMFNPDSDPQGTGYQLKQSLIAIGSGGVTGRGLGMFNQRSGFLPQSMSDSTFAVFAEETGLIGSSLLVLMYVVFFWAGISIAKKCHDKFYQLTVLGIVSWIILQGFVNISSMIGIFPLGGVPLPFISYGGSHLISELIGIGIIMNIVRVSKK